MSAYFYHVQFDCQGSNEGLYKIHRNQPYEKMKALFQRFCDTEEDPEVDFEKWIKDNYGIEIEKIEYSIYKVN